MEKRKQITWPLVWFQAIVIGVVLVAAAGMSWGHNGGLARDGCHNDKAAGERHCHAAPMTCADGECTITIKVPEQGRELTGECVDHIDYLDSLWSSELFSADIGEMVVACLGE